MARVADNELRGITSACTRRRAEAEWARAATEARFRQHFRKIAKDEAAALIPLEEMLDRLTMDDVVCRRHLDASHRAYVPDFGVALRLQGGKGIEYRSISRHLVLFCVERRKAWRMLQSKAGIENRDYKTQRDRLSNVPDQRLSA